MKNLIVVRHGNYTNKTDGLTKVGFQQIEKLAKFIKENFKGDYYFACSGAIRAAQSAGILRKNLGCRVPDVLDELFDEEEFLTLSKAKKIHEKVIERKELANNLVLVSHYSVATGYPVYFMQKEFGEIRSVPEVAKGKAVLIDVVNKEYDIIPK